jgi:hypothetical protein
MKLYEIVNFNEETCSVLVKYGTFPEVNIELPINDLGLLPTGEELDIYITGMLPRAYVERMKHIGKGVNNLEDIKKLVVKQKDINDSFEHSTDAVEKERQQEFIDFLESI